MRAGIVTYPGSNCDRDLRVAFEAAGFKVVPLWHKDSVLPAGLDVVGIPGGFSFGDYLRCGAIAARAPITRAIVAFANTGGVVIGICNGFQVLIEAGLLPGALMRNANLKFICKTTPLRVEVTDAPALAGYRPGQVIDLPIAHHDGNFVCDDDTLARLQGEGRIALRYADNPNGSTGDIAGVLSDSRRVLGLMPHPERAIDARQGSEDGLAMFTGLLDALAPA